MQVVIVGEYELDDVLKERENAYGVTDPAECAKVDMDNDPSEFLFIADVAVTMFRIKPVA